MSFYNLDCVPSFYHKYLELVPEPTLIGAMAQHTREGIAYLQELEPGKWGYRYAEGKWSIKEVVQHLIDAERIFQYRALCFSRGEAASLPGFDENEYARKSEADRRSPAELMEEWRTLQSGSQQMFASFTPEMLTLKGTANGCSIYVEAIGGIIVGHARHHLRMLRERY